MLSLRGEGETKARQRSLRCETHCVVKWGGKETRDREEALGLGWGAELAGFLGKERRS